MYYHADQKIKILFLILCQGWRFPMIECVDPPVSSAMNNFQSSYTVMVCFQPHNTIHDGKKTWASFFFALILLCWGCELPHTHAHVPVQMYVAHTYACMAGAFKFKLIRVGCNSITQCQSVCNMNSHHMISNQSKPVTWLCYYSCRAV